MNRLLDRMATRRAEDARLDIAERRRERQRRQPRQFGSADGGKGAHRPPSGWQPSGPNDLTPRHD